MKAKDTVKRTRIEVTKETISFKSRENLAARNTGSGMGEHPAKMRRMIVCEGQERSTEWARHFRKSGHKTLAWKLGSA